MCFYMKNCDDLCRNFYNIRLTSILHLKKGAISEGIFPQKYVNFNKQTSNKRALGMKLQI